MEYIHILHSWVTTKGSTSEQKWFQNLVQFETFKCIWLFKGGKVLLQRRQISMQPVTVFAQTTHEPLGEKTSQEAFPQSQKALLWVCLHSSLNCIPFLKPFSSYIREDYNKIKINRALTTKVLFFWDWQKRFCVKVTWLIRDLLISRCPWESWVMGQQT